MSQSPNPTYHYEATVRFVVSPGHHTQEEVEEHLRASLMAQGAYVHLGAITVDGVRVVNLERMDAD